MSESALEYYKRRLDDERRMAGSADTAEIAALHAELAALYEKMISALEGPPAEAA